jgi:signal transduction histidine kinase/DNA-binding response OmpR family regulator
VLICGLTLSLAFSGLYLYDRQQFTTEVQRRLEKTKVVLLDNLMPMLEQNPGATDLPLSLLETDPQILAAAVYSADGKLLSRYLRPGSAEAIPPLQRGVAQLLNNEQGVVWTTIRSTTRKLGTLYLKAEVSQADVERFTSLLRGSAIVFLASSLLAFIAAYRLQRHITRPITELAAVSASVQRERDYGIRVVSPASGEIGSLIDSFNAMLDTIQTNTTALDHARMAAEDAREKIHEANDQLEEANRTLEARVEDRTRLLVKASRDAEEASKAKSSFLAKMSHELRTPLNAIIGYSEIMKEDAVDDGDTRRAEDLDKVLNAARHLLGLINDVLDISKIEAGKMELYLETFELQKILNDVVSTATPLVSKKGNTLKIDCPADIGSMHADATKLRQMLLNLLSNASKFTENGLITVKAVRSPGDFADSIELSVIDTGIGMNEEQLGRLFKAFSQADASTSSKYGGTGLGLAISKQFAQMMKGDITVTSTPGRGSVFTIRLPADVQIKQPVVVHTGQRLTKSPFPVDGVKPRVLIIDDDAAVRKLISDLLKQSDYLTIEAGSGQNGIDLAIQDKPDLIILDAMLQGVDGWTVLTRLQGNRVLVDIPVVVLSGANDTEMAMSLGASSVLLKPVDAARLTAEIAMQLSPLARGYVLVVEDEPDARDLLARMLDREGWPFRAAASGNAALHVLKKGLPGIILLDLKMAGMNGFELLEILTQNKEWAKIPVIIVSSMDITPEMRDFLNPRVVAILQKGRFNREDLASLIRPVLKTCALAES